MEKEYINRVELHCHSKYSKMDGIASPREILEYADGLGMQAVATTDTNSVLAFPDVYEEWKRGIYSVRPIYGMEALVTGSPESGIAGYMAHPEKDTYPLTILICDETGRKNLYKMISISNEIIQGSRAPIHLNMLRTNREGLLLGSACKEGYLYSAALAGADDDELREIAGLYDFIELCPEGDKDINKKLVVLADELDIPVVAVSDSHYMRPDDKLTYEVLRHYSGDKNPDADLHLKTTEEMLEAFDYLGPKEAVEIVVTNTNLIAEKCRLEAPFKLAKAYPETSVNDIEKLRKICLAGISEKYTDEESNKKALKQFDWELEAINKTGMAFIFLLMRKLYDEHGVSSSDVPSRGSWGSSITAYLCGLTDIDPLKYNLSPEFVFGIDQDKEIDMDFNFPGPIREAISESLRAMDEFSAVVKAGTVGTTGEKKAEALILLYEDDNDIYQGIKGRDRVKEQLTGIYRADGIHPGAWIFVPKEVDSSDYTPYTVTTDGYRRTYFEYHALWKSLFKLDLLRHDSAERLYNLAERTGVKLWEIPSEDEMVLKLFMTDSKTGMADGCVDLPEFRDEFSQGILKATKPQTYDELVKLVALSHGTDTWTNNAERLVADGTATIEDILGSREDVFDYCISLGIDRRRAFLISDNVRKGKVSRGKCKEWPEWKSELISKGAANWFIWSCEQIKYMFPRAHAASYMQMTWRLAWFKVYYQEEFEAEMK